MYLQLLEIGADPNYVATDDYCNTPLHLMARKARWLGFYYLVKAGADVNVVNTLLQTPLMVACDSDIGGPRLRIIDIILEQPGGYFFICYTFVSPFCSVCSICNIITCITIVLCMTRCCLGC